ncbi:MAG: hypothetical protein ACRD4O_05200, partial [Bryobacteraceae bacterium]
MECTPKLCFALAALVCTSCNSSQPVAAFAANAQRALDQGPPLFRDLYGSCVRAHLDRRPVEPLFKGKLAPRANVPRPQIAACSQLKPEGDALATDSAALSAYFKTIHELAAFDTSATAAPS